MRRFIATAILFPLLLTGCGGSDEPANVPTVTVSGARNAVSDTMRLVTSLPFIPRPAALLSIYANILLSDGTGVPVRAALDGVNVQVRLHGPPSEQNIDDLYTLLEEFGAVLHVDVPDLLNRSTNRVETLDLYTVGLGNITERSRRRSEELGTQMETLNDQQKEQKAIVTRLNKDIRDATKAKDYGTLGQRQQQLAVAQTDLTRTELKIKELKSIRDTFAELLKIAQQRIASIEANREVLIAGFTVVDIPGVEDLGVIEGLRRSRSRFNPFGDL